MSRHKLATAFSVVLTALMMPSIQAQDQTDSSNTAPRLLVPNLMDRPTSLAPTQVAGSPREFQPVYQQAGMSIAPTPIDAPQTAACPPGVQPGAPGYVRLGAAMYPSPRPNIPIWTGSTVITNQAFAPHEMLYPHTYRAIYPPFYHRVTGGWILTPLGVRSHEHWRLQGTTVEVKYRSSYPGFFSGAHWAPPVSYVPDHRWK